MSELNEANGTGRIRFDREWERELVQRMVNGEDGAFEQFADEFLPRLYRFAASLLERQDATGELTRDLVQTTLCKAIQKIGSFRGEARLFTWLCTCCRNEVLMHFRRAENRAHHIDIESSEQPSLRSRQPGPHQVLSVRERSRLVHRALDRLPAKYSQALEWKYIDRLAVREIATRLALGVKATESLLTRARAAFRKSFENHSSEESDRNRLPNAPERLEMNSSVASRRTS